MQNILSKTVSAFDVRRQFGKMLDDILGNKTSFIVEKHGHPVAVIVPMYVYEDWKKGREKLFSYITDIQQSSNLSSEDTEFMVNDAIRQVRKRKQK